jgi:hypothetical protein
MSDDIGEDLAAAWSKQFASKRTINERRKREARPLSKSTRRRAYMGEAKTVQFNLKITPSLRAKVEAMAIDRRVAFVELFEMAIEALEGAGE